MAQLTCTRCGAKGTVPTIHDGPGVQSTTDPGKLVCPIHGDSCMPTAIPSCCGTPMQWAA